MTSMTKGDKAPAFTLLDQHGNTVCLSDYKDRNLLIYFYPKADTPGCTIQACSVRDNLASLQTTGTDAVGISPDKPAAQLKFDNKFDLGFPLLCDVDHAVAEAYGVCGEKQIQGKTGIGIIRSAFLIGKDGRIIDAWYKVSPADTVPKVKAALENPA